MRRGLIAIVPLLLAACRASQRPTGEPRIERKLDFVGATTFDRDDLEETIALDLEDLERRSSPKSAIDDAAYSLLEFYRARGFVDCAVDYELRQSTPRSVHAVFRIVEGPRCVLSQVVLTGELALEPDELLAAIGLEDVGQLDSERRWFVASEMAGAADELQAFFGSKGFRDARVTDPEVTLDDRHEHASVVLRAEAGVQYRVAALPRIYGGIARIDGEVELQSFAGRPLAPRVPLEIRGRIEEAYAERGYPDVRVDTRPIERDENGRVELGFDVVTGPRVTIAKVVVSGNEKTRKQSVLGHVQLRRGDVYDVREVRESFRALYRTGLFRRVRIELEPGEAGARELRVEVEELPSTEIFFEPGYGSYEGLRALVGVRENNVFGSGRSVHAEGLLAMRAQRIVAGISDPRLFDSALEGSLSVFQEVRDEPSFDKDERGMAFSVSRELRPKLRVSSEYRLRSSEVSDVDFSDPLAVAEAQDVDISSVALSGSADSRDSVFVPSHGHLLKLSVEFADEALGSELDFVRTKLSHASFFEISDGTVFGVSWRAGVISPIEDTLVIPVQERFFNGGENTVRSFKEDELPPTDPSAPGGEAFNVLSAELRQRLRGNLESAAFYDTGNVESDAQEFFEFRGFRHALGLGIRYALPIGPVRLDVAWNPDPRDDEDEWVAHFSVGTSF